MLDHDLGDWIACFRALVSVTCHQGARTCNAWSSQNSLALMKRPLKLSRAAQNLPEPWTGGINSGSRFSWKGQVFFGGCGSHADRCSGSQQASPLCSHACHSQLWFVTFPCLVHANLALGGAHQLNKWQIIAPTEMRVLDFSKVFVEMGRFGARLVLKPLAPVIPTFLPH